MPGPRADRIVQMFSVPVRRPACFRVGGHFCFNDIKELLMSQSVLRMACSAALMLAFGATVQAQAVSTPATAGLPDFTGIVQRNAAAVVHVEAKYNAGGRAGRAAGAEVPDDEQELFRRFFGMPMQPSPEQQQRMSLGSGFIISKDGYVLTNNHVVEGADEVVVRLQDRRSLKAKVIGTDPKYDIALLKIDDGNSLPTVVIGDSRALKAGQWVLAIGSPFGFDYTVTQGIVSAVGRNLGNQDQPYTSFIQTDVPINRGNSGGPCSICRDKSSASIRRSTRARAATKGWHSRSRSMSRWMRCSKSSRRVMFPVACSA